MKNSSYAFFLLLLILNSCNKEIVNKKVESTNKTTIKYAKGFDIVEKNGNKKLIIKSAYKGFNEIYEYTVYKKSLSKKNKEDIIEVSFDWMIKDEEIAVKVYSMNSFYYLGIEYVWIYPDLSEILGREYAN